MSQVQLYNEDCLNIFPSIPNSSIPLIVTDPPYGDSYLSNGGPRVSKHRKPSIQKETSIMNDSFLNPLWFSEMFRVLSPSGALYCFCSFNSFCKFSSLISTSGFNIKNTLVWDKGNSTMGDLEGDYGNQTELIIFATKNRHILNGGRDRNILRYPRPSDATRLHPTEKPVPLLKFLINKSSRYTDTVLDPFMGSGSTGVACKSTNRKFVGCEIDPIYFHTSQTRINNTAFQPDLFS